MQLSAATTPGSAQGAQSQCIVTAFPNPGPRDAKAKRAVLQDEPPADANVYGYSESCLKADELAPP